MVHLQQTLLRVLYDVTLQAGSAGKEFLLFLFRHPEFFQCGYSVGREYLPVPLTDVEPRMGGLHIATPVDDWAAESRT